MEYTLIRTILKEGFEVTLEELRSRLIEVCKGKEEFVEALSKMEDEEARDVKYHYDADIGVAINKIVPCVSLCCEPDNCPFYSKPVDCHDYICPTEKESYDEFVNWWNETLNLAIASCKGEEVEEATPADNPSKPLFIVTKVDDLIGLESEDGKFRICRNSNAMGAMYEAIGVKSFFPYYQFEKLDLEAEQILGELGFRFTIQERKSYLELLEECEEVKVEDFGKTYTYYVGRDLDSGEVRVGMTNNWFIPGIKYISKEDADRIVKECVENA